jgi:hypothetical protein
MPYYFLTEEDHRLLQEFIRQSKRHRINTPSRPGTERSWDIAEDHQAPEVYVAKPQDPGGTGTGTGDGSGIPGLTRATGTASYDEPGVAACDIYKIYDNNGTPELRPIDGLERQVYNVSDAPIPQDWITTYRTKGGAWVTPPIPGLIGFMLAEDHPGRGIAFEVWLGQWNSAIIQWEYPDYIGTGTIQNTVTAIDWRYDVPYPAQCAQGLGVWRPSDEFGKVIEVVALDCSSMGCT